MQPLSLILFSSSFLFCLSLNAQSASTLMGARAAALGYASETLGDEWSILNNVGGLAQVRKTSLSVAAEANPSLQGANRIAVAFSSPLKNGAIGIGVFRFGDNVYNEQLLSAGYSHRVGITSVGLKINYTQYQTEGFGSKGAVSLCFGGITNLAKFLTIGAFITDINQPQISKTEHEKLPTLLNAGISLKASEKFTFLTGIQKDLDINNPVLKFGLEYIIHPKFTFRTGFNLHPDRAFLGFGFKHSKLRFDYALQYNGDLGGGHQVSITYRSGRTPTNPKFNDR